MEIYCVLELNLFDLFYESDPIQHSKRTNKMSTTPTVALWFHDGTGLRVPTSVALHLGVVRDFFNFSLGGRSSTAAQHCSEFHVLDSIDRDDVVPIIDWLLLQVAHEERMTLLESVHVLSCPSPSTSQTEATNTVQPYVSLSVSVHDMLRNQSIQLKPSTIPKPLVGSLLAHLDRVEIDYLFELSSHLVSTEVLDADVEMGANMTVVQCPVRLLRTLEASTYFQVSDLQRLLSAKVASDIRNLSVNAARAYLMEPDDLTLLEKAQILEENRWMEADDTSAGVAAGPSEL